MFFFASEEEKLDVAGDVRVAVIERGIKKFDRRRSDNAFAFFSRMIFRLFKDELTKLRRRQGRARLFTDVEPAVGRSRSADLGPASSSTLLESATPYNRMNR